MRFKAKLLVSAGLLIIVLIAVLKTLPSQDSFLGFDSLYDQESSKPIVGQDIDNDPRHLFWAKIFGILEKGRFDLSVPLENAVQYVDKSQQQEGPNSKSVLLSKAYVAPEVVDELKQKHEYVMSNFPKKLSDSTHKANSNGIVMIGGQRFSWLSYLSLVNLRKAGSELPVEIILPQYDDFVQEQDFCHNVLPKLKAKCVVLPEVLGAEVMTKWADNFANYQLKSLALMVSSFQNVLLLDSDNIVIQNPDKLFESSMFKTHGMVTWPDYWRRTISPVFYDISGLNVNENKRVRYNRFPLAITDSDRSNVEGDSDVPFHDLEGAIPDLSTESGQLMINKDKHACTLFLSMYYNMLGPNLYYKLFSLGEQGEGDKDTFPAAATVCGLPFYQVKSFIKTLGYADSNDNFQGVAMGQKDALVDYENFQKHLETPAKSKEAKLIPLQKQMENIDVIQKEFFGESSSPLFAIHCNYPKLDPKLLLERDDLFDIEQNRLKYRIYGGFTYDDPNIKAKTIDFEHEQWKNIERVLCIDAVEFPYFKDFDMEKFCIVAKNQIKSLHNSPP